MTEVVLIKTFTFAAAHYLPFHYGKCKQLHGHTYKLEVYIKGEIKKDGMVCDFINIEREVRELVLDKLDHHYLNDIVSNPTAENLCVWIKERLPASTYKIRLWETETSGCEL